jgi:hypothetical protein
MDDVPRGLFRPFGRLRWPWRFVTVTTAERAPLVCLNRYPGQAIGVLFRLPDGRTPSSPKPIFFALSILWALPDVRAYPRDVTLPVRIQSREGR